MFFFLSAGESSYILLPDDGNETLVDKSLDETVEQPAEQPVEQSAEQSAEQSPEQPAEQLTDEPAANQEPESIPELDPNTLQPEVLPIPNSININCDIEKKLYFLQITQEEQLVDGNNGDEKMELEVSLSSEA